MDNVLAICHGRAHRKIQEINYETATFLDPDPDANADRILDIEDPETPYKIDEKFTFIINAFCPTSVMFKGIERSIEDIDGNYIDGKFNPKFFGNIRVLLKLNGIFYTRPKFFFQGNGTSRNVRLMEDKMFMFGFKLVEPQKTFTFDNTIVDDFMGFQRVKLPTGDNVCEFIQERMQLEPKIKFFTVRYYDSETVRVYIKDLEIIMDDLVSDCEEQKLRSLTMTTTDDCTTRLF